MFVIQQVLRHLGKLQTLVLTSSNWPEETQLKLYLLWPAAFIICWSQNQIIVFSV